MKFVIQYSTVGDDEQFYLNPCSIQDALKAVGGDRAIETFSFEFDQDIDLEEDTIRQIKTAQQLSDYLTKTKDFDLKYIEVELEDDLTLTSEDEKEVSVLMPKGSSQESIVESLVKMAGFDSKIVKAAKDHPTHYCVFDSESKQLVEQVESFDDLSI